MPLTIRYVHRNCLDVHRTKKKHLTDPAKQAVFASCLDKYSNFTGAFRQAQSALDYSAMARALNEYLDFAKSIELAHAYLGSGSKYYSSILEEMPVLLISDRLSQMIAESERLQQIELTVGGEECLIRVGANPDGSQFQETKRVDFCVALKSQSLGSCVPLVGFEVKKYMDKTMFGTVLETYKALQIFRPRTVYGFIVEDENRAEDVVRNSPIYQAEFILTGKRRNDSRRNPILAAAIEHFSKQLESMVKESLDVLSGVRAS